MTSCKDVSALVSRALDERLTWPQRLQVRAHLAMCSACRSFERQSRFLSQACKALRERVEGNASDGQGPSDS